MFFIQDGIVIIIFIIAAFGLFIYHRRTQQALLWWNNRLWMRMCEEGEEIRNGLLQDSFAMRRYLELSTINAATSEVSEKKHYLEAFEKFHTSLNELSDYLFPPHIDDSLPLAMQHLLDSWKFRIKGLTIESDLPSSWYQESHQLSRIILMILDELLRIYIIDNYTNLSIVTSLNKCNIYSEIIVTFIHDSHIRQNSSNPSSSELKYLHHSFQFLTNGLCNHQIINNREIWSFRWSN
jgi:hypothetical protein